MDKEYYTELAKVRLERANELLMDAQELLAKESYKSANNARPGGESPPGHFFVVIFVLCGYD